MPFFSTQTLLNECKEVQEFGGTSHFGISIHFMCIFHHAIFFSTIMTHKKKRSIRCHRKKVILAHLKLQSLVRFQREQNNQKNKWKFTTKEGAKTEASAGYYIVNRTYLELRDQV